MPEIELEEVWLLTGLGYQAPIDCTVADLSRKRIGEAGGLQ